MGESSSINTGCDSKECESSVCSCDPYCCQVAWDMSCAKASNFFVVGCSADLLCCKISIDEEDVQNTLTITSESLVENANVSFGGKQYKSFIQYGSCNNLSCIDAITFYNFPEISSPDGITFDKISSGTSGSSITWYGEPKYDIGSATFTQGAGANLMGAANVKNFVFQFETFNNDFVTNVISQDNFPDD